MWQAADTAALQLAGADVVVLPHSDHISTFLIYLFLCASRLHHVKPVGLKS